VFALRLAPVWSRRTAPLGPCSRWLNALADGTAEAAGLRRHWYALGLPGLSAGRELETLIESQQPDRFDAR